MNERVTSITEEPRYAQNIQNWEAFWSLEDIGRPLWVFPMAGTILAMLTRMVPVSQLMKDKVDSASG